MCLDEAKAAAKQRRDSGGGEEKKKKKGIISHVFETRNLSVAVMRK